MNAAPPPGGFPAAASEATSSSDLAVAALDQAIALSLSVYDASYLALALKHGACLITADQQLDKAAASLVQVGPS